MLPSFCKDCVTIKRAAISSGTRRERDWANAASTTVRGCSVQPSSTSGDVVGREDTETTLTAYMPPSADVRSGDRVVFDGLEYSVIGEPRLMRSPLGSCDAIEVALKRWRG